MQILLNTKNLQAAVLLFVQDRVQVADDESLSVELTEDGAIVTIVGPNEVHIPVGETSQITAAIGSTGGGGSTGEAPKRRGRRSRAEIEADNKAEAARLLGQTAEVGNQSTVSAETAPVGETASSSDAGGESQPESPAVEPETPVTPTPDEGEQLPESPVAVVEEDQEPETSQVVLEEPEPEVEAEEPKTPTASLFANLRKPKN